MQLKLLAAALPCAGLAALNAVPASAHVVAGDRVFPVTLTFDDPGVSDEASFPAITYTQTSGPTQEVDLGFEYDKTITSNTALILNYGYDIIHTNGSTQKGFENLFITGKWQTYTNAPHEFVVSLGVIRELGDTGSKQIDDEFGSTSPAFYFGKGLGDLPIGVLRPLAVTGELTYTFPDKSLKTTSVTDPDTGMMSLQFNNGASRSWSGGLSLQYSIPYLQSQVKNIGLTGIFSDLIPIVEFTWSSATSAPSQQPTMWTAAPGVIYLASWGEIGVEALFPLNKATGTHIGVVGLVHFFFDDLFPNSIGKPIFQ
jgi:hypothetical protein